MSSLRKLAKPFLFRQQKIPGASNDDQEGAADGKDIKYSKRREQVRRAQRTHRERKQYYVRALEEEVLDLKGKLASTEQLYHQQMRENAFLRDTMAAHNVPISQPPSAPPDSVVISYISSPTSDSHLRITNPPSSDYSTDHVTDTTSPYSSSHDEPLPRPPSYPLADPQTGMNFVLALEHPCLGHTPHPPNDPTSDSGHALSAQASLLSSAPGSLDRLDQDQKNWEVPAAQMNRLLELGAGLGLTDEVTPVQMWDHLRRQKGIEKWTEVDLETFRGVVMAEVRCYGFGAVVDREVFEELVRNALGNVPATAA